MKKLPRVFVSSFLALCLAAPSPAAAHPELSRRVLRQQVDRSGLEEKLSPVRSEPFDSAAHPELVEGERPAQDRLVEGQNSLAGLEEDRGAQPIEGLHPLDKVMESMVNQTLSPEVRRWKQLGGVIVEGTVLSVWTEGALSVLSYYSRPVIIWDPSGRDYLVPTAVDARTLKEFVDTWKEGQISVLTYIGRGRPPREIREAAASGGFALQTEKHPLMGASPTMEFFLEQASLGDVPDDSHTGLEEKLSPARSKPASPSVRPEFIEGQNSLAGLEESGQERMARLLKGVAGRSAEHPFQICFLCNQNLERSPTLQLLLRDFSAKQGMDWLRAESGAVLPWLTGEIMRGDQENFIASELKRADRRMRIDQKLIDEMAKRGPRKVSEKLLRESDLILVTSRFHPYVLEAKLREALRAGEPDRIQARLLLLKEALGNKQLRENLPPADWGKVDDDKEGQVRQIMDRVVTFYDLLGPNHLAMSSTGSLRMFTHSGDPATFIGEMKEALQPLFRQLMVLAPAASPPAGGQGTAPDHAGLEERVEEAELIGGQV